MDAIATMSAGLDRAARGPHGLIWHDQTISYARLADESRRIAQGLLDRGIEHGDHVALWMPNAPEFLSTFFACSRIGVAVMLVNTRLSGAELADIIDRSDARALIYAPDHPAGRFREHLSHAEPARLAKLRLIVEVGAGERPDAGAGTVRPVASLADLAAARPIAADISTSDSPALLYSTSGSSGPPKLVLHTQASLSAHAADIVNGLGLDADHAVHLVPIPLAGAYGFTQATAAVLSGRPTVLLEKFDAKVAHDAIRHHEVTNFGAFDDILIKLLAFSKEPRPFPSLRLCTFGIFTPGYAGFEQECEDRGIRLAGLYGASEVQAFFATQRADGTFADRIRQGGFPVSPRGAARVRNTETGELCKPGESGELEISGPSRMSRYHGNEKATRKAILPDGFYRTGDTARMAEDGSFIFEGRMEEILRLSGYMVPAAEIETFLRAQAAVDDAKVVDVLTEAGSRPVAFLLAKPGASIDLVAVRGASGQKLARFKQPISYHVVDEWPMVGSLSAPKVDKKKLKALAQALHDEKQGAA